MSLVLGQESWDGNCSWHYMPHAVLCHALGGKGFNAAGLGLMTLGAVVLSRRAACSLSKVLRTLPQCSNRQHDRDLSVSSMYSGELHVMLTEAAAVRRAWWCVRI